MAAESGNMGAAHDQTFSWVYSAKRAWKGICNLENAAPTFEAGCLVGVLSGDVLWSPGCGSSSDRELSVAASLEAPEHMAGHREQGLGSPCSRDAAWLPPPRREPSFRRVLSFVSSAPHADSNSKCRF